MKEIKLSQHGKNKGKYVALVDDWNYDWLSQWKWHVYQCEQFYYAARNIFINGHQERIQMHRQIMNTPLGFVVDHRDHNGLNCQEYNMRNCTQSQNCMNRNPHGRSKYLGVYFQDCNIKDKIYTYIKAQIRINKKSFSLGNFNTEEDAAHAYDKAAKELFGEFANLNFK